MRAAVLQELGSTPVVTEFREPEPGAGEVVVDVLAAGLNPIDLRVASGVLANLRPPVPSVVGSEGVGRTPDGRRAYFAAAVKPWGSIAERTVVREESLLEVPDGVEDGLAVALGVAGTAGWNALARRARLREGEKVLVLGASGVVGSVAVQAAKLLGAAHVTAAARSAEGLERAAALGADATVRLEGDDLTRAFLDAGGPYDVAIDPLWGAPASAALEALAEGGRMVSLGQSAGAQATFLPVNLRFKELSILGYTNFLRTPEEQAETLRTMWGHAANGRLRVDFEALPLDQVGTAWEYQAGSPGRKLVLVPSLP